MFCYQCEQTAKGTGCTAVGVCGKSPEVASLQDLLVFLSKGISMYANRARKLGARDRDVDIFVLEALFSTITNVNFDEERMESLIYRALDMRKKAKDLYKKASGGKEIGMLPGPAIFEPAPAREDMIRQGAELNPEVGARKHGEVLQGLHDLILISLKGSAAYADHARVLGFEDEGVFGFFHEFLDFLSSDKFTQEDLVKHVLGAGEWNVKVMALLDSANTKSYGDPVPTKVRVTPIKGKAILVSGHDLKDLDMLLKQTAGKGINIYTHGEMLPCHGYPGLNKHPHLAGNYGGAWQDQEKEFDAFPGAILMTTNCIQKPKDSYIGRLFTTGLVAWPGAKHIGPDKDFTPVIEAALATPGFEADAPDNSIMVGFGHEAVMSVAGNVIEMVKAGKICHFFLVGGCDGAKSGRNYYTDFAKQVPKDCVILTLACGKYRFNKLDFGDIDGIPRLLDVGQCNDAYSAVKIAQALAGAFETDINGLPLSLILSWYEQKAVCILLSLLFLGVKNIRLGPTLPAFVKPPVLEFLHETFNLMPITTPEEDLKEILGS